jgi:hypothetical protein
VATQAQLTFQRQPEAIGPGSELIDADDDGHIDFGKGNQMLHQMGVDVSDDEDKVYLLICRFDLDGNGLVTFPEFLNFAKGETKYEGQQQRASLDFQAKTKALSMIVKTSGTERNKLWEAAEVTASGAGVGSVGAAVDAVSDQERAPFGSNNSTVSLVRSEEKDHGHAGDAEELTVARKFHKNGDVYKEQ